MNRIDFLDHFLDSSSSDSSSDDEGPRIRLVKPRNNLYNELDDIEFIRRFRLSKNTVEQLANMLDNIEGPVDGRNQPLSKINQILIALRYYATGSFQINIGDHFNVSQPTVSRVVTNVTKNIAALRVYFIKMPQIEEEQRQTVLNFFNIAGFPGIIGALDCTHIKIRSPGGDNAEVFRNRKSWFSINTQVIGDADLKICDVVARWPGSVHDTTIFNDSNIRAKFESNQFSPYCLVGDGGYPCRPYLLTPINALTPPHQRYNTAQIATRNPIERLFGVWNRRIPCLSLGMNLKPEKVCEVIVATAVLHNICIEAKENLDFFEDIPEVNEAIGVAEYNTVRDQNTATRDSLISTIFA